MAANPWSWCGGQGDGREGKGGRAGGSTVEKREMAKLPVLFFLFSDWVLLGDWCSLGRTTIFLVGAAAAAVASRWRFCIFACLSTRCLTVIHTSSRSSGRPLPGTSCWGPRFRPEEALRQGRSKHSSPAVKVRQVGGTSSLAVSRGHEQCLALRVHLP